jgi:hypothetical protein
VQQLEVLQSNGRELTASFELSEILPRLLQTAQFSPPPTAAACSCWMSLARSCAGEPLRDPADMAVRVVEEPSTDRVAAYVVRTGQARLYQPRPTGASRESHKPALYMPLRQREQMLGCWRWNAAYKIDNLPSPT